MTAGIVAEMQASLAQAGDTQIARVVAMVDALPQRGQADALIAPLRPRLAQIRPARPLGFTRLLFTPLNPVIVPTAEWQRSGVGVPRPALAFLGEAVRATLAPDTDPRADAAALAESGPTIWPAAAAILDGLPMPDGWPGLTGLTTSDYPAITRVAASVLHEAVVIERLVNTQRPVEDSAVRETLSRSKARGVAALDTVVAVLLARLPSLARIVTLATEAAGADRATGQAIDRLAASLSGQAAAGDLQQAAMEAARTAALLAALEDGASPERRSQLQRIRRDADMLCRRSFNQAVTQTLALTAAAMTAASDDEAVAGMEACARDLRRLEAAGRKLGSGEHYDALLTGAATAICDNPGSLGLADQVRLVEILAGPDEAMALLSAARSPPAAREA